MKCKESKIIIIIKHNEKKNIKKKKKKKKIRNNIFICHSTAKVSISKANESCLYYQRTSFLNYPIWLLVQPACVTNFFSSFFFRCFCFQSNLKKKKKLMCCFCFCFRSLFYTVCRCALYVTVDILLF